MTTTTYLLMVSTGAEEAGEGHYTHFIVQRRYELDATDRRIRREIDADWSWAVRDLDVATAADLPDDGLAWAVEQTGIAADQWGDTDPSKGEYGQYAVWEVTV